MSKILKQSRDEAKELFKLGLITKHQYEKMLFLTARDIKIPAPEKYDSQKIQRIREALHFSQKVFADIFGVTVGTISKWERGVSTPNVVSCRYLAVIERQGLNVFSEGSKNKMLSIQLRKKRV